MLIDFNTISIVLGIITTLMVGAIWVLTLIYRISSQITGERKRIDSLEEKQKDTRSIVDREKEINETFRHKYKTSVEQMAELMKLKFESIEEIIKKNQEILSLKIEFVSKNKKND